MSSKESSIDLSSQEPTTSSGESRPPPVWKRLDKTGWLNFKAEFEHYVMTCTKKHPKSWHQCLDSKLCRQIGRLTENRLYGGTEKPEDAGDDCKLLKDLEWKKAMEEIDKELAPDSHASALEMFAEIKMEHTNDAKKFTLACLNYIDEFEMAESLTPEGTIEQKQIVTTFIAGIKPKTVRERVRGKRPEKCHEVYEQLMAITKIMRTVEENVELYKGLTGGKNPPKNSPKDSEKGGDETNVSRRIREKDKASVGGECRRCGRTNHKEADCIAKRHGKTGDLLLTELSNQNGKREKEKNDEFPNDELNSKDLIWIKIQGNGGSINTSMIADTGASHNFIDEDFITRKAKKQGIQPIIDAPGCTFRTANGIGASSGSVTLKVHSVKLPNGKEVEIKENTTFHMVKNLPVNCILGRDFLEAEELVSGPLFPRRKKRESNSATVTSQPSIEPEQVAANQNGATKGNQPPIVYDQNNLTHIHSDKQRMKFDKLMKNYNDLFDSIATPAKYPPTKIHFIQGNKVPQQAMPRVADTQLPHVRKLLKEMIELGVLERCSSPASSRFLLVKKPDGTYRLTVDLKELNGKCESVKDTMPTAREIMVQTKGAKIFCTLDLSKFFYQLELAPNCRYLTAMSTPIGKLQFKRLPMGYKNSPAIAAAALHELLHLHPTGSGRGSCSYVDDILVYAKDLDELYEELESVLSRLREAGLKLSKDKVKIAVEKATFVGHEISGDGTAPKASRFQGIERLKMPTNKKEARSFVGVVNYSKEYVKDLARILKPIYEVMGATAKFEWGQRQQNAFKQAKAAFMQATPLAWWEEGRTTILETDASEVGIGAVLYQTDQKGKRHTLGFYSQSFNKTQANWSTIEQEGYGIFRAVKHWEHLLYGRPFRVKTDHANLRYMEKSINKKVGRWWSELTNYQMEIEHTPGAENVVADGLSRLPDSRATEPIEAETTSPTFLFSQTEDQENKEKKDEPQTEKVFQKDEAFEAAFIKNHNAITGHMGIDETVKKIRKEMPNDPQLREKVKERIQSCAWCQKDRIPAPMVQPQLNVLSTTEPFTSVSIDTMGPLPEDEDGNRFIIVVIDDFTRYVELFAASDTTAQSAAKALVSITGRYGRIRHIRSDGGSQYIESNKGRKNPRRAHGNSKPCGPTKQKNGLITGK